MRDVRYSKPLHVRLTPEQRGTLQRLSKGLRFSESDLVRFAIASALPPDMPESRDEHDALVLDVAETLHELAEGTA